MTVSSTIRKAGPFAGNNAATTFPFGFKVFAKGDVKVLRVDLNGLATTLTLDSDYSVMLNANQDTNPGGWVTYPISGNPLASGYQLVTLGPAGNTVPLAPGTTGYFQPDNSPLPLRERMMNWGRNLLGMGDAVPTGNAQGAGSAQAFIQNYAKQNGMTVGQERDAVGGMSEIPTQFAQGFENSFTAGLAPDVNGPAQTTSGQVASGLGTLAGFVTGAPLKVAAGAVEKVGGALLEHVAGESFAKAAAKDVIGQASTLGLASAITATGDALNQNSPEAALTTIGLQGLHGAEMGGVFDDARAFVKRDPRIAKMLDTGRGGNDPRMVLLAVEAARRARARGEQF